MTKEYEKIAMRFIQSRKETKQYIDLMSRIQVKTSSYLHLAMAIHNVCTKMSKHPRISSRNASIILDTKTIHMCLRLAKVSNFDPMSKMTIAVIGTLIYISILMNGQWILASSWFSLFDTSRSAQIISVGCKPFEILPKPPRIAIARDYIALKYPYLTKIINNICKKCIECNITMETAHHINNGDFKFREYSTTEEWAAIPLHSARMGGALVYYVIDDQKELIRSMHTLYKTQCQDAQIENPFIEIENIKTDFKHIAIRLSTHSSSLKAVFTRKAKPQEVTLDEIFEKLKRNIS